MVTPGKLLVRCAGDDCDRVLGYREEASEKFVSLVGRVETTDPHVTLTCPSCGRQREVIVHPQSAAADSNGADRSEGVDVDKAQGQ